MSDSESKVVPASEAERRLHPWSWLFVLIEQLKSFVLPLLLLWLFGRGGDWQEYAAAVATVVLTVSAVYRYFTYRFRIDSRELVIRSGLLARNVRHLPFKRIQHVELRQNLLHRAFGVAQLRLESATGGDESEAVMNVLALDEARSIEARIRAGAGEQAQVDSSSAHSEQSVRLQLPIAELLRLGLTRNHGWVVVGAAFGIGWQIDDGALFSGIKQGFQAVYAWASQWHDSLALSAVLLLLVLLFVAALRLVGTVVVLLRYYDFRLHDQGRQLALEAGLLTRYRQQIPLSKVQRWVVETPWLLRLLGRSSASVETAGRGQREEDSAGRGVVVPIARAGQLNELLSEWGLGQALQAADWRPIHPRAWRRWLIADCFWPAFVWLIALLNLGSDVLPLGLLLLLPAFLSWRSAVNARFAFDGERLLWRRGGLSETVELVEVDRIQSISLRQSPLDRRAGMINVAIDTAGASQWRGIMLLRSLAAEDARALADRLAAAMRARRNALLAPEHRRQQDQDAEHLKPTEQHAERAHPDGHRADVGEMIGHRAETGAEIGDGGGGGAEGTAKIQAGSVEAEHQQHKAGHPQGDKAAD
ncbi:PH domain-containing protein [Pseudoxanthomonas sp. CAU 1598]|uniref:PH domain-containing protein n=1 Tax=Pseudomarimonas arenosa TaxID=2774145 RepID=A0AAW3ZTL7_9GAMM|nr:PH domain-containing protein [Pseudomarimonas arenosa]